ncbi:MAG: LacI family DNA-binding transcriptional regulator [Elusimicrobia bacterium]|nr:LacI family DNA-binding transcriptional regulator [Elusimicrobiota bacterium]
MNVTIKTVAKVAGVSPMTVSRVINESPFVNPKTREEIKKVIRDLNYQPNMLARAFSQRRKEQMIGLVVQYRYFSYTSYFMEILRRIESTVDKLRHDMILFNIHTVRENIANLTKWYHSGLIKGFIIIAPKENDPLIQRLIEEKVPFIIIGSKWQFPGVNFVDVENEQGAYMAVSYLIKLGHKRIGFIGGPENRTDAEERKKGYIRAISDHNLPIYGHLMVKGDFNEKTGAKEVKSLINSNIRPTAIFAANDLIAIGAMKTIKEHKLKIPRDISIIGFDDIDMATQAVPSLTTVHQPIGKLGEIAAEFIINSDDNKINQNLQKILKVRLVKRESCYYNKKG